MEDPDGELLAREFVMVLLKSGKAKDLMEAYSDHNQSCAYVYSVVHQVAWDRSGGMHREVITFCQNLLDDWSK
jgi:hypothetical protein